MSDGGVSVLDGTQLRDIDLSLPFAEGEGPVAGAQVLDLAESRASLSLLGLTLPETLTSAALRHLGITDAASFRLTELDHPQASSTLRNYVTAIADELQDDPIVVAVLDGKILKMFLEDEDDFAMLAENLFTDLDVDDRGKIRKSEVQNGLRIMGVEMGIPPFSEFPQLSEILKKHGAEGEEELGQAQFAQLLQLVLQELADALAQNHVLVVQNIKIVNGTKLKKLLADDERLNNVVERIMLETHDEKDGKISIQDIRCFLEKNGRDFGLPPLKDDDDMVSTLYDDVFADIGRKQADAVLQKDEMMVLVKKIIEKFAEQLEANPVFHDSDN